MSLGRATKEKKKNILVSDGERKEGRLFFYFYFYFFFFWKLGSDILLAPASNSFKIISTGLNA